MYPETFLTTEILLFPTTFLITVVAYSISAAIALYFLVSNLTMIAQEYVIKKHR